MARLGLDDCRALVVGFPFCERIGGIDVVIKDFLGPSRIFDVDRVLVVNKARDDIEDFSLLPAVENLCERRLRHATHFDPGRHIT